jgi:hypothetical protein
MDVSAVTRPCRRRRATGPVYGQPGLFMAFRPVYGPPGHFMGLADQFMGLAGWVMVVPAVTGPGDRCMATRPVYGPLGHFMDLWPFYGPVDRFIGLTDPFMDFLTGLCAPGRLRASPVDL